MLLADDLVLADRPCLSQMLDVYAEVGGNLVAVMDVPRGQTDRYGILDVVSDDGKLAEAKGLVEKPKPDVAPSTLSIIGRYILQPEVFKELWERVQQYAAEYGRADQVTDSSLHLMVNINDDTARAYQEGMSFLERYYGVGNVSEEKVKSWLAHGSPAAVIDKINQFLEAGCTTPVLRFVSADQRGQLERCVHEVLPAFEGVRV